MYNELTTQQFCALDYYRNMVVTSGPGAGKTKILSHRYCFILLTDANISISQILTLTFTEKAAEEMKTRIYQMLLDLEKGLNNSGNYLLKNKITATKKDFNKNRISTIHSFCAGLLREYPVEAGIDPGFYIIQGVRQKEIIEESIEKTLSIIWKNEKDLLMPLLHSFGSRRFLINALRDLIEHPISFQRALDSANNLLGNKNWIDSTFRDYCRSIMDKSIIPYFNGLKEMREGKGHYNDLMYLFNNWTKEQNEKDAYFGIPGLFEKIRSLVKNREPFSPRLTVKHGLATISYVDLVDQYYPDLFVLNNPDAVFQKELEFFLKVAGKCLTKYKKEKEKLNSMDFNDLETRSYLFLKGLCLNGNRDSLQAIQKSFKYIMIDEFQDTNRIQWDIIKLLCVNGEQERRGYIRPGKLFVVGDKRQSIYRFRGGDVTVFEEVTNEIKESNRMGTVPMFWQRKEMEKLICEIINKSNDFIKKQNENFRSLSAEEKDNILKGNIYLPHNFRSDSCPISFFNRAFNVIFSNKGAKNIRNYETPPGKITLPEIKRNRSEGHGSVTFYLSDTASGRNQQIEAEAALIADIIEGILGRHGKERYEYNAYADIREKIRNNRPSIGILFFSFTHLKTYENVLRESDIPFSAHRGRGFYRCQEIMDILQLLNYLIDERQHISLLAALRSPIFGLTDQELFNIFSGGGGILSKLARSEDPYIRKIYKQLDLWRSLSTSLTIPELIRAIISHRFLTAIYSAHPDGIQKLANIEKLVEISRCFQMEDNGSLNEFVEYCLNMAEEEAEGEAIIMSEEAGPISLMTIHAAKGLEFPMVIIPDLDRKLPNRPRNGKPVRLYRSEENDTENWNHEEGEIPVWPIEIAQLEYLKKYTPLGYLLMRRNRLEDIAENRRVFYVGCTRARNHLVLLGRIKKKDDEEQVQVTSEDYRERATIQEILDDIYGFNINYSPKERKYYKAKDDSPGIVWYDPKIRAFRGIRYGKDKPDMISLGIYDKKIENMDISGPVQTYPYYQLSFTSIQLFMKCPIRFYYDVILGLKAKYLPQNINPNDSLAKEAAALEFKERSEYSSKEALFLGNFIHAYMEKHDFGESLNIKLFNSLWEGFKKTTENSKVLKEKALGQLMNITNDKVLIDLMKDKRNYREIPFLFSVKKGIEFRGIIDRIFKDEVTGLWSIIDWKSNDLGNRDPEDIIRENNYAMQLAFYKWAVEKLLNERVEKLYTYFADNGQLLEVEWRGSPLQILEEIVNKVKKYEEDRKEWERDLNDIKKNNASCGFCEYQKSIC